MAETARGPGRHRAWVCLMYHDITAGTWQGGGGPGRFSVPADAFERQLDLLAAEGYAAMSLGGALRSDAPRAIAVTFDDGNAGQYERGFRALAARGMSATFFVTSDWVGRPGFVSWDQLREMRQAGMEVQSHSRSHRFLSELDAAELDTELRGSKDALDQALGQATEILALPGGDWPRRALRGRIAAAGYRVVATSRWGVNRAWGGAEPRAVRRCTVQGPFDGGAFRRIAAGDAWLAGRRLVREQVLATVRGALGATRYARLRRLVLDRAPR